MNDIDEHDGGRVFWLGVVIGWSIIVAAIAVGLGERDIKSVPLAGWVLAGLFVHDVVWLTAVATVGGLVAWMLRRRVPAVIGWALGTTVVLVLVAWPFVRGYGRRDDVPSALPRNYSHGLVVYVLVVWSIAAAIALGARIARRRADRPEIEGLDGQA